MQSSFLLKKTRKSDHTAGYKEKRVNMNKWWKAIVIC